MTNMSSKQKNKIEYYDRFTAKKNEACLKKLEILFSTVLQKVLDSNAPLTDKKALEILLNGQIKALRKKNASLVKDPATTRDAAMYSFLACEFRNKATNDKFRKYHDTWDSGEFKTPDIDTLIQRIRRKISEIMGPAPSLADLDLRFGPGEVTSCKKYTTSRYKLSVTPIHGLNVSQESLEELLETVPHYAFLHYKNGVERRVGSGEIFFVPKNAETDRTCEKQLVLNSIVQKGIGSHLKTRLRSVGIDLSDQSTNSFLARWGSSNGCIATLDLKEASNSIALWVVYTLLPSDWFNLLNTWRSPKYDCKPYNLTNVEFQLFSSMGNGFTFELESLLFYSIAKVIMETNSPREEWSSHICSIFGDDLVVETEYYEQVKTIFEDFGFIVNNEKSYRSGPFRESCGGDYYSGIYVRPFFIKDCMTPARLVGLHNHYFGLEGSMFELTRTIRLGIRRIINEFCVSVPIPSGPPGLGDGHLHSLTFDWKQPRKFKRNQFDAIQFESYGIEPATYKQGNLKGDLIDFLYNLPLYSESSGWRIRLFGSHVSHRNLLITHRESGPERDPYTLRGGERPKLTNVTVLPSFFMSE